ncbi:unnamed protein product [Cylicocyclus nassatus]|uniref:Uncharacterized protein n=1 Tax=Cylicocyclus nassatus TaxID=53992 RepID=A0AA36MCA0_CYLNA|nr:unnamed protein product [Cylicocyclus nassatus]
MGFVHSLILWCVIVCQALGFVLQDLPLERFERSNPGALFQRSYRTQVDPALFYNRLFGRMNGL